MKKLDILLSIYYIAGMKTSEYIVDTVNRLHKGYVFTCADLTTKVKSDGALRKVISRLVPSGKIAKLAKGKFYKPEKTPFGTLAPDFKQVVKDLLESNGKIVGYLTELSVYNKLGLTTQVSNAIQIGRNEIRSSFRREQYAISFIKQKNYISHLILKQPIDCQKQQTYLLLHKGGKLNYDTGLIVERILH